MSTSTSIRAAAYAIATHTELSGIEDEGKPAEIGMFHLLWSMMDYSEAKGVDFDSLLEGVSNSIDSQPDRHYLVRSWSEPGPCTVAMPLTVYEKEVRARSVREACEQVVYRRGRHPFRNDREAYTGRYIEPDWSRYAAAAVVREGKPADIEGAVQRAFATGFAKRPSVPEVAVERGAERDAITSAEKAIDAANSILKADKTAPDHRMRELLLALAAFAEWNGVNLIRMAAEVKADREMCVPKI